MRGVEAPDDRALLAIGTPVLRRYEAAKARAGMLDYDDLIVKYAGEQGIRPNLVRAVVQVESGYNPKARSRAGAVGLMQLMPDTAREMGVQDRLDPEDNVQGGARYLKQMLTLFDNDITLAVAASSTQVVGAFCLYFSTRSLR